MKRYTLLIVALTFLCCKNVKSQSFDDFLRADFFEYGTWPVAGYVHSNAYPLGFYLGPFKVGFNPTGNIFYQTESNYVKPKFTVQMDLKMTFAMIGPIGLGIGINGGVNYVECYRGNPVVEANVFHARKIYGTFTPMIGMNFLWFNAFIGYEFVPNCKEIQGLMWSVGASIPFFN